MRAVVIGGTGTVGSHAVRALAAAGAEVVCVSRRPPSSERVVEHRRADLVSGAGLDAALGGADVVVDAANDATSGAREVLVAGTQRALLSASRAGAGHYVLISIVGIDAVPMRYYRAKLDQERAVEHGPLPWTILRATQFHELIDRILSIAARWRLRPSGSIPLQPVAAEEVGVQLAEIARGDPRRVRLAFAGPQVEPLGELSRAWTSARRRRLVGVPLWLPGAVGAALRRGALCDPRAPTGSQTFESWLHAPPADALPPHRVDS